jgi:predicted nucleic acid-binding protein
MTEAVAAIAVCDAGPLIHLDELDCLPLLADFSRVLVPERVWTETTQHRADVWNRAGFFPERIPDTGKVTAEIGVLARVLMLHSGEVAALQVARGVPGSLLLTDDTAARLAAKQIGVPVHGTIGILLRAIRRKQKTAMEVVELLRSLPERSTLHLTKNLLQEVLAAVEATL